MPGSNDHLNEFQCHNGMHTAPNSFFRNDPYNPDCLDRSDERYIIGLWDKCYLDPAFRCEEHACHPIRGKAPFPCGDGQCVDNLFKCGNGRGVFNSRHSLSSDISLLCQRSMICLTHMNDTIDISSCTSFCSDRYASKMETYCPSSFPLPPDFIALDHVYFLYTNDSAYNVSKSIVPTYVCYDRKQCEFSALILNTSIIHNENFCFHLNNLNLHFHDNVDWYKLVTNVDHFFVAECLKIGISHCSDLMHYRCTHSSKCISKHRLVDGSQECIGNDDEIFNQTCSLNETFRFRCSDEPNKCISSILISDGTQDCIFSEDEDIFIFENRQSMVDISFPITCDNFQELKPIEIDGRNETDETECGFWPCDSTYTKCNQI